MNLHFRSIAHARIAIIGLSYVGLPLALAFARDFDVRANRSGAHCGAVM